MAAELATWSVDIGMTCRNLGQPYGHEDGLPARDGGQAVALTAGFHASGEIVAYLLHRTGHPRLEQFPRYDLIGTSTKAAAYSVANGNR